MRIFSIAIVGLLLATMLSTGFAQCLTCGTSDTPIATGAGEAVDITGNQDTSDTQPAISTDISTDLPGEFVPTITPISIDIREVEVDDIDVEDDTQVDAVVDELIEETEEEDNFTSSLPQGALISAVEHVKRDHFKELIRELKNLDVNAKISEYTTRFNTAINGIKDEIREKINEEELTVEVVQEVAERELIRITEEIQSSASEEEIEEEIESAIQEEGLEVNSVEVLNELETTPEEFKQRAYRILKAGLAIRKEVLEQFTQAQEQARLEVKNALQNFKQLQEENQERKIEELRSLLSEKAQLSELINAMGA